MFKIKCNTEQLKKIQQIAFDNGLTWPNGGTTIQIPMGSEHFVFMDKEYIWTESADAFTHKDVYETVEPELYIQFEGNEFPDEDEIESPIKNDDLPEFRSWSDSWVSMSKDEVVQRLISGKKLQGDMFDSKCYLEYDSSSQGSPFRFIDLSENYHNGATDGVWDERYWREFVPPKKMTIKEIERELGFPVEVING